MQQSEQPEVTNKVRRRTKPAWVLLREAAGGPFDLLAKTKRLALSLARTLDGKLIASRMARLEEKGILKQRPSTIQLVVGSIDMLRFWISPAAADYYERSEIHFGFHQLLRFLDEPSSVIDPVGFMSTEDGIIGHLMQVVHANPHYDLQLLEMFDGGIEELIRQLRQMLNGTHPRTTSIGAIVEEADYHARLLAYSEAYLVDRTTKAPLRMNIALSPHLVKLEQTFGTLTTAMEYFCELPSSLGPAAMHLLTVREFRRAQPHVAS